MAIRRQLLGSGICDHHDSCVDGHRSVCGRVAVNAQVSTQPSGAVVKVLTQSGGNQEVNQ